MDRREFVAATAGLAHVGGVPASGGGADEPVKLMPAMEQSRKVGLNRSMVASHTAYLPSRRVLKSGGYEGGEAMKYMSCSHPGPFADTVEKRVIG
jgi:hypothetical protein